MSDEAKDLFTRILNTDPEKRYSIAQIRQHPWFNIVKNESTMKGTKIGIEPLPIDKKVLAQLDEYEVDRRYATKCLNSNKHNWVTASYYLLLKEKRKGGEDNEEELKDEKPVKERAEPGAVPFN